MFNVFCRNQTSQDEMSHGTQTDYTSLAIPERTLGTARSQMHKVGGSSTRYLQDRRLCTRCQTLGQTKESTKDGLRQTQQIHPPVLQERYNQENGTFQTPCLPVLPRVLMRALIMDSGLKPCPKWFHDIFFHLGPDIPSKVIHTHEGTRMTLVMKEERCRKANSVWKSMDIGC